MRKKTLLKWVTAVGLCLAVMVGGALWLAHARSRRSDPTEIAAAGGQTIDRPTASAEAVGSTAEEDLGADARTLVEEKAAKVKPIEWPGAPKWDGTSQMSPEKLRKVLGIVSRYDENFRRIQTISLHDKQTRQALMPLPWDPSKQGWDVSFEATKEPIFFKVKGQYWDSPIDATVTPVGKIGGGQGIGFVESMAPVYFDGLGDWSDMQLRSDMTITEDVPLEKDILDLKALEGLVRDDGARYDVLSCHYKDGYDLFYWFNRETGMLDCITARKSTIAEGENPFQRVKVIRYGKAGDVFYPVAVDAFSDTSYLSVLLDGPNSGRTPSRDFDSKSERVLTGVVINGIPAE